MADISRREMLRSVAAAGAAAMLPGGRLVQAEQNRVNAAKRGRIDVHHHMLPPFQENFAGSNWKPEQSLDIMDKYGTETAILSLTVAADLLYDGTEKGRTFARRSNEYGAKIVQSNPKRFGLFAALPLTQTDGCLREIEYAFDTLKCDGIALFSNTGDKWPGDPLFAPVFDELNRRKAAVFFHPTVPNCCRNLVPGIGDGTIEFDFDTTRAITQLLFSGTLARCPDLKIIVNHSGAAVPVLAGRIKDRVPGAPSNPPGGNPVNVGKNDKMPEGAWFYLKKLYFECAHAAYPAPIAAVRAFAPTTQLLFGTDYPIERYETTVLIVPDLKLPADVQAALDRGNAERLFPRFK